MEPRPRRKRVDRGESSTSSNLGSNGVFHHSDHSRSNGNYEVNHNEDDSSSSATAHCNKSNRTNGNGARVVARRKRIQSRRKQKRLRTLVQRGIYIATCSFFLYCCIQIITLQRSGVGPTISNSSTTKQTNSASFPIANNQLNDGNGETTINKHPYNEEYERRLLSKIPNHNRPLTEEEEQDILNEAHDELNEFPISIGTDDNGNNLDWETIQHPGTEALKFFTGSAPRKKRPTAQDLAGVLSGKKLRGADNNDNLADGTDGYMRVPKFWDPVPYRIIADEREKRSGITAYHDLPRDGVRRYLGNFGSRIMTPIEAKSIGSRIPSRTDNSELLETICKFNILLSFASYSIRMTNRKPIITKLQLLPLHPIGISNVHIQLTLHFHEQLILNVYAWQLWIRFDWVRINHALVHQMVLANLTQTNPRVNINHKSITLPLMQNSVLDRYLLVI